MAKLVDYTVDKGLAIIELNNPPAHAYGHEMMRDLDDAILQARFDDDVHVIILRGKGGKVITGHNGQPILRVHEAVAVAIDDVKIGPQPAVRFLTRDLAIAIAVLIAHPLLRHLHRVVAAAAKGRV